MPRDLWLKGFALLGGLNLTLGLVLAFWQPARAGDLWKINGWCHQWLYEGVRLYASEAPPDYPPNAIVTYALLATIPTPWVITVWATTTLIVTLCLPYAVLCRFSKRRDPFLTTFSKPFPPLD